MIPHMDALTAARDMMAQIAGPDIHCVFDIAANLCLPRADPYQFEFALLRLASNARNSLPSGGTLTLTARNVPSGEQPPNLPLGAYVSIATRMAGARMASDFAAGLAFLRNFAEEAGGSVRFADQAGESAVTEIILPSTQPAVAFPQAVSIHGDAVVLLCEPDRALRQATGSSLRHLGYTVLEAGDDATARALAAAAPSLDIVLTEAHLPGAAGLALAMVLREQHAGLRVAFMSGAARTSALDGETVLVKPFTQDALASTMLQLLGREKTQSVESRVMLRLQTEVLRMFFMHWQAAKLHARSLPPLHQIDPGRFGLLPYTLIINVNSSYDPPRYDYDRVGAALNRRFGGALDGRIVDDLTDELDILGSAGAAYRRCVTTGSPSCQSARFDLGDGDPLRIERLLLPVSNDGECVSHLVGVIYFSHYGRDLN